MLIGDEPRAVGEGEQAPLGEQGRERTGECARCEPVHPVKDRELTRARRDDER